MKTLKQVHKETCPECGEKQIGDPYGFGGSDWFPGRDEFIEPGEVDDEAMGKKKSKVKKQKKGKKLAA